MGRSFYIRSSFARRLLLVFGLLAVGLGALAAQSARLSIVSGERLLDEAENRLVHQTWTPTVRGRIRDRKGRVLAYDRPSFDISVDYDVITGEWAERQAASWARRNASRWAELSREQRRRLIQDTIPAFRARENRTWALIARESGMSLAEVDARRLDIRDQVDGLVRSVRARRERNELIEYGGTLGYTSDDLERRAAEVDRPDVSGDAERLRHVLAEEITREAEARIERSVRERLREQVIAHVMLPGVDDETGFRVRRAAEARDPESDRLPMYPGLRVVDSGARAYPLETIDVEVDLGEFPVPLRRDTTTTVHTVGVASHVLGSVRRGIYAEDVDRRADAIETDERLSERSVVTADGIGIDRGRYVAGDIVGKTGLESTLEDTLRGLRGLRIDRLDENDATVIAAEPGRDVTLTLDIMLQARIRALLDPTLGLASVQEWHHNTEYVVPGDETSDLLMPPGTPIDAAAVVIDIETGDLLAMVSTPTLSRDRSELPADDEERERYLALHRPYVNRAIGFPIPPGSIAKALVLCGAHRAGVFDAEEHISCTGHLYEDRSDMLRCWIYKSFGSTHDTDLGHAPNAAEALKVSCNIFFYTLGRRLGPEGIADVYRSFGVGEELNLPLAGVISGWLGRGNNPDSIDEGDAIQMGIGQGPVAWTPVHAADSFATIARGGVRIEPRLLADTEPNARDLGLDPAIVNAALHGLDLAVNDPRGTAHSIEYNENRDRFDIFDTPGVKVWGKTGTATAPLLEIDGEVVRRGDHSWFVLLCGRDAPRYAIAVVAEYGGSGGRVSGPIANQIIRALVAEGYL